MNEEEKDNDDTSEGVDDVNEVEGGCKTRKRRGGRGSSKQGSKRRRPGAAGVVGAASSSAGGASSSSSARGGGKRRRPLGKKRSMIDRRNHEGKRLAAEQAARTPAENARAATLARFGQVPLTSSEQVSDWD